MVKFRPSTSRIKSYCCWDPSWFLLALVLHHHHNPAASSSVLNLPQQQQEDKQGQQPLTQQQTNNAYKIQGLALATYGFVVNAMDVPEKEIQSGIIEHNAGNNVIFITVYGLAVATLFQ
ncbi:hypothetical protein ACA910_016600 [Epithemia clementina (nom. ined.)]